MDYFFASLLGFVQGITEFVPVSSSGHLVLLHEALQFSIGSDLAFDVALHAGTLVTTLLYFGKDIIQYFKRGQKFLLLVLISCLPAGFAGWLFEDLIDYYLRSSWVVVVMLVAVAGVFFVVEKYYRPRLTLDQLSWQQALLIGCAQAVALIPGTSRSGVTISTGMRLGLDRTAAARFSFIMVIPLLLGLTLKQGLDLTDLQLSINDLWVMLVGVVVSALTGLIVIKFLLVWLRQHSLRLFAWYRLGLALVVSLVLLF